MSKNWDLKPGDIVTSYFKGVYEVIKAVPRYKSKRGYHYYEHEENENSVERVGDIVTLRQIYTGELKPYKGKVTRQCDSGYCSKVSGIALEQIKDLERKIEFYKQFIPRDE